MAKIATDALRQQVMDTYQLEPKVVDDFIAVWQPATVLRKHALTRPGDIEKCLYFVQEGVQRIYYLDPQGRETSLMFSYQGTFGGVIDSFFTQQPSRYFYEALTKSTVLKMTFDDYEQLSFRHPALIKMALSGVSGALSGVMERLVEVQTFSSEEKFRALLKRSPHILQLVPHKYLASYLGIDATNFSKLLNRVRI